MVGLGGWSRANGRGGVVMDDRGRRRWRGDYLYGCGEEKEVRKEVRFELDGRGRGHEDVGMQFISMSSAAVAAASHRRLLTLSSKSTPSHSIISTTDLSKTVPPP
jgi:hypothetical protein